MTENFLFKAIFISLAVHTTILWAAYLSKIHDPHLMAARQHRIEISYRPAHKKAVDIREYPIKPAQQLDLNDNPRFYSNGSVPVSLGHEKSMLPFNMFERSKPERMTSMELSRRVSIMPISSEKINNPVYAAYNEMVRDRIKEKVYQNYDKMEMGTVYLTFLLDEDGTLKAAQIIQEKTNAPEHLQEIALKSLRDASPFPPFLKGMNLSEYPFNIQIQYQVSDD